MEDLHIVLDERERHYLDETLEIATAQSEEALVQHREGLIYSDAEDVAGQVHDYLEHIATAEERIQVLKGIREKL